MKQTANYSSFEELDVRVGRVVTVEDSRARKPTYRLTVDFGPEIGVKRSVGAYRNYRPDQLVGRLVVGIVNFGVKQMGPELSEVLILGVENDRGETIYLTPESDAPLGTRVF